MAKKPVAKSKPNPASPIFSEIKPSIPSVERPMDNLKDLQASFNAIPSTTVTPWVKKKKERAELSLSGEGMQEARKFITAKLCAQRLEAYDKTHRPTFDDQCRDAYVEVLWARKSQPENPSIKIRNEDGVVEFEETFIIKNMFTIQMPEVTQGQTAAIAFRDQLISHGMGKDRATKLVEQELLFRVRRGIMPIDYGKDSDKEISSAMAQALVEMYRWLRTPDAPPLWLSNEAKDLLWEEISQPVTVRDGFLDRVTIYCQTIEELRLVLKDIRPVSQHSFCKGWENTEWRVEETDEEGNASSRKALQEEIAALKSAALVDIFQQIVAT